MFIKYFQKYHLLIKLLILILCGLIIGSLLYSYYIASTKIALINFPSYQTSNIILANKSRYIDVREVDAENASTLSRYDAILVFGPGLRLTKKQIKYIERAGEKGSLVHTFVFQSDIINSHQTDSIQREVLDTYYRNGCKDNFENMLLYIRHNFDTNKIISTSPLEPIEVPKDVFYHLEDGKLFNSVSKLTNYLKDKGLYKINKPNVALISGMTSPLEGNRAYIDSLIAKVSDAGYNVYPMISYGKRLEMLKQINPSAIIYLPMGRIGGDEVVRWMEDNNVALFCPYPIMQSYEEWINDPRGQIGGFLTARIVLPEIDGGICSLPISTQNMHDNLYYTFDSNPERLNNFVSNLDHYLSLRTIKNSDKRIAICYFKGAGGSPLAAEGLEATESLYQLLINMANMGYDVSGLPHTFDEFESILQQKGSIYSSSGSYQRYVESNLPYWITKSEYEQWVKEQIPNSKYKEVLTKYGDVEASSSFIIKENQPSIAITCLQFGNVVLFPQPRVAEGGDDFKVLHGADVAPPHAYIAPYLWVQKGFKAHALIHFGTHGSLEFTPGKQTALSRNDWADCLIGSIPHFYYYTTGNVGEAIIAKRRLHATIISHLTPPFIESDVKNVYSNLSKQIDSYYRLEGENEKDLLSLKIKANAVQMGISKDLQLDTDTSIPYTEEEISYIENFAEEVASEKILGRLYTLGEAYSPADIIATTLAMTVDPLAYSVAKLDLLKGKISDQQYNSTKFIVHTYINPIRRILIGMLEKGKLDRSIVFKTFGVTDEDLLKAKMIDKRLNPRTISMSEMMAQMDGVKTKNQKSLQKPANMPKTGKMPDFVKKMLEEQKSDQKVVGGKEMVNESVAQNDRDWNYAITEIEFTLDNILEYKNRLELSPKRELESIFHALDGGYVSPSPGGDVARNPNTLPTGRNLFSINAEATPSVRAWDNGVLLAKETLKQYFEKHKSYPQKVSYTLWAGEFIESEGATFAQILYMLGVDVVRDRMHRVTDLRLIPSNELKRPRIDVAVQTSGQLRDLAASRLLLLTKAIKMAAAANDSEYDNYVSNGCTQIEKELVDKGVSPLEARELSTMRVFGGLNGQYGTGIMGLVEQGDAWDEKTEIAKTYLHNMGAIYGDDEHWGNYQKDLFGIVLKNTDIVVQPRQNNTWGALSLDHMYEFMGGLSLAVQEVTGVIPETYLSDYRNRSRVRLQDLKEAVGVESRTTILNPKFIKEKMKGGSSSAQVFAKTLTNTFAWSIMKEGLINEDLWNQIYDIYITDCYNLGVTDYLMDVNSGALQGMLSVMLESVRKEIWNANKYQVDSMIELLTKSVDKHGICESSFTSTNKKLQKFILNNSSPQNEKLISKNISKLNSSTELEGNRLNSKNISLTKSSFHQENKKTESVDKGIIISISIFIFLLVVVLIVRNRRKYK